VDGGTDRSRSLYVVERQAIRPILTDVPLHSWIIVEQGKSGCSSNPDSPEISVFGNFTTSFSMADTVTNGYRDIVMHMRGTIDGGRPEPVRPATFKLRYDGKQYPSADAESAFHDWQETFRK
jgi:hypothetical protein